MDERNFSDIIGHNDAKRALMIAVAGNHPAILLGPPGSGKNMLANRVAGIIPTSDKDITFDPKEFPRPDKENVDESTRSPFRSPHHSISDKAFATEMRISERGVLYLDEYALFKEKCKSKLLWNNEIYCSTTMLIAGDHFCDCGYYPDNRCSCSRTKVEERKRQFDTDAYGVLQMWITVKRPAVIDVNGTKECFSTEDMSEAIGNARKIQSVRYENTGIYTNAEIFDKTAFKQFIEERLGKVAAEYLKTLKEDPSFTERDSCNLLRIARTVADISGSELIKFSHLEEAYRNAKAYALSVYKEDSNDKRK